MRGRSKGYRWERLEDSASEEGRGFTVYHGRAIPSDMDPIFVARKRFHIRNRLTVNIISEFFITFVLFCIGTGISAQTILSGGQLNNFMALASGWSLLVAFCIYATLYTSGCHMNPVVTVVFATLGRIPYHWILPYMVAQLTGALLGISTFYYVYRDTLVKFSGGQLSIFGAKATAPIFTTFPEEHISNVTAFFEAVVATGFLLMMIIALTEPRNNIPLWIFPSLIGGVIFVIVTSYAMSAGGVINPVGNFAGRLFCFYMGYGWEVFSWHGYYFWIPVVGPFVGGLLGAWSYVFFVEIHIPDPEPPVPEKRSSILKNGLEKSSELDPLNKSPDSEP